ncbi:MAG TPA: M56 family metallopeptidase, partial [Puia sp.]|nr:M56 family metallopeptidase [Puia sp.]
MPLLALYLIKLSFSLSFVWLFYQLFLRRLTFYNMNRWYLLGYSLLAFIIPLINIGPMVERESFHQPLVIQYIPSIGNFIPVAGINVQAATADSGSFLGWSTWNYFLLLIVLGAGVLFVLSAGRWLSLRKIRRQAALIDHAGIRIYQVDEDIIPFSFGNSIYINQRLHSEKEWEEIILHEYVHIRQQHTVDILFAELLCILNWYNPFVWLLRHSIRQNLEFIADSKVLENGVNKKNYQYHLLKVIGEPRYRLANNFNFSSLKKRIVMMNKIRSARLHLLKLVFLLPLMAVLLLAFRGGARGIFRGRGKIFINTVGIVVDVVTRQPLEGVVIAEKESGLATTSDKRGYFRMVIPVKGDSMRVDMHYSMDGYDDAPLRYFAPSVTEMHGLIADGLLKKHADPSPYMMIPPFFDRKTPVDPGY